MAFFFFEVLPRKEKELLVSRTIVAVRLDGEAGAPAHPPSQDIGLAGYVLGEGPEVGSPFTYSRR